jgi:riboflavin kinase/FMN adenylyltransferase
MKFIRGLHNLPDFSRGTAVTIGNFDGVHRGHQYILQTLCQQAKARQLPSVVILFEPQPQEYFQPEYAPVRLTPLRDKLVFLAEMEVDYVVCLHFNATFAHISAHDFIDQLLVTSLNMRYLLVGEDFHFGYRREGNFTLLQQAATIYCFDVERSPTIEAEAGRISSTRIRQALQQDDFVLAERLLGRCYSLSGRVMYGHQRGRTIGFPTANIRLPQRPLSLSGVYVVDIFDNLGTCYHGVANMGVRPTVDGVNRILEVHIFDFDRVIYGQPLRIVFLHKLRNEQRFSSFDALQRQIQQDVIAAKHFFRIDT